MKRKPKAITAELIAGTAPIAPLPIIDTSTLTIESGIPLPPAKRGPESGSKWTPVLTKLTVGDSFLFPVPDMSNSAAMINRVRGAVSKHEVLRKMNV